MATVAMVATRMTVSSEHWLVPDWPAPPSVRCLSTTRHGGVSQGVYASLNLGDHVGDDPQAVAENRLRVCRLAPGVPVWLEQVHGTAVVDAGCCERQPPPRADAAFAKSSGVACAVMTADCLPVLFCDRAGSVVAAAHAGWRGLLAGVLEQTVAAMDVPRGEVLAWLGPAIGPAAFEVGEEVRAAFVEADPLAASAFHRAEAGKYFADLYALARQRLAGQGVARIYGGDLCTFTDTDHFFSYRRDGQTGRMASLIWLESSSAALPVGRRFQ